MNDQMQREVKVEWLLTKYSHLLKPRISRDVYSAMLREAMIAERSICVDLLSEAADIFDSGRMLTAEVRALKSFEDDIRAAVGSTNWYILMERLEQFEFVVFKVESRNNPTHS